MLVRSAAVFVVTLGLVGAGAWVPTQSRDEAATVSAVQRSWPELFAMLGRVDVVHGLYYAAMKLWLGLTGVSTVSLRLPSVLACALAAALLVVLGALLANPRAGLLAGLTLAVSPRLTLIATEGRSAAAFTATTVLLVLLVVAAVRRPSWGWNPAVALTTAVLGFLHVYTVLLLPVLLIYLAVLARPSRPGAGRRLLALAHPAYVWPGLGLLVGAVPVGWLALRARTQQAQVDWIDPPSLHTLDGVGVQPFSPDNGLWAVLAWAAATGGIVWLSRHRRRYRGASWLLVAWVAWPPLALLTTSAVGSPLYSHRYLAFCMPALAMLAGMGLASIKRGLIAFLVAAALPLAGLGSYRAQRQVDSWDNWQQIIDIVSHRAVPGDVMINYPLVSGLTESYPDGFAGVPVLNAGRSRLALDYLWDERLPLEEVEPRLAGVRRLWYIVPLNNDGSQRARELGRLKQLGFHREQLERTSAEGTWLLTRTTQQAVSGDELLRTPG